MASSGTANIGIGTGGNGTTTVTITIQTSGSTNNGTVSLPIMTNANSPIGSGSFPTLAIGANTITIPTNAGIVILTPPAGNLVTWTIKGVGGDTGIPVNPGAAFPIPFANPPPANFVINATAQIVGFGIAFY